MKPLLSFLAWLLPALLLAIAAGYALQAFMVTP